VGEHFRALSCCQWCVISGFPGIQVFSLGCFSLCDDGRGGEGQQLLSMVIGEEQSLVQVEGDVGLLLASAAPTTTAMYVISLGKYSSLSKHMVVTLPYPTLH
jgi:hypothetical protein